MSNDRLFRQNVFLGLAYIEAIADPFNPTAAELNNATLVKDFTCGLWEDGTEFTLGDSESDDGLTFCSNAGDSTLTTKNATVTFRALRDKDRAANGLFNLIRDHISFPDVPFYAIERVGYPNTTPFAVNQKVRIVRVRTDNPVDDLAVDANAFITQSFLQDDVVAWNVLVD